MASGVGAGTTATAWVQLELQADRDSLVLLRVSRTDTQAPSIDYDLALLRRDDGYRVERVGPPVKHIGLHHAVTVDFVDTPLEEAVAVINRLAVNRRLPPLRLHPDADRTFQVTLQVRDIAYQNLVDFIARLTETTLEDQGDGFLLWPQE